jgi:hypothetical protein
VTSEIKAGRVITLMSACAAIGCAGDALGVKMHPGALVGRWERQISEKTWGDTLDFRADGTIGGVVSNPVPATARWYVQRNALGTETFCAINKEESSCQTFAISGDLLTLRSGPTKLTTFRRVR